MNDRRVSKMILLVTIALLCSVPLPEVQAMKINQKHQQQLEAIMASGSASDEKFVGTLLWDIFDLLSFGVFEKKPSNNTKNRKNNRTNESNYTNGTNVTNA